MSTSGVRSRAGLVYVASVLVVGAAIAGASTAVMLNRDSSTAVPVALGAPEATSDSGTLSPVGDSGQIGDNIRTMLAAMQSGDVGTVQRLSCGEFAKAFAGSHDVIGEALRQAYQSVGFTVESVHDVDVHGATATADATERAVHHDTGQVTTTVEVFQLQRVDGQWKVCDSH